MAYLFGIVDFPAGSRLTHVWDNRRVELERTGDTVTAHFVRLPHDQHADVESDFVSSHLPFALGGVAGTYPHGSPWLLVFQQSATMGDGRPSWREQASILDHAMQRALTFNPGAEVEESLAWSHDDLLAVYGDRGVESASLQLWTTSDLVVGLLAECCGAALSSLADGFVSGCAFPGDAHPCQGDVFGDAFVRWHSGRAPAG